MALMEKKNLIKQSVEEKYNIFDFKKRRERLRGPKRKGFRYEMKEFYSPDIFSETWNKFKSVFGHMKKVPDPEDPLSKFLL